MISVNISTIKQYFWYFDNFNKSYKIRKHVLPVLKMKDKYYIFNNKNCQIFDEFGLSKKNFVPYDKQYSYKVIDETTPKEAIVEEFENFICVFIVVDDTLKWTIEENELLKGNEFYEKSIADNDLVQFNFVIKKKPSKEIICNSTQNKICTTPNSSVNSIISEPIVEQLVQEIKLSELTKTEYETQYEPPIPDPVWEDFVFIEYDPVIY